MPKTPRLHRTARTWLLDGPLAALIRCGCASRASLTLRHHSWRPALTVYGT